jgi:formylglycine-generating enzyme required for sulfatase activity
VQDCYHDNYDGAPADGSAWVGGDCGRRVVRGGSWFDNPQDIRMACRVGNTADFRDKYIGFRVGRTLLAPDK